MSSSSSSRLLLYVVGWWALRSVSSFAGLSSMSCRRSARTTFGRSLSVSTDDDDDNNNIGNDGEETNLFYNDSDFVVGDEKNKNNDLLFSTNSVLQDRFTELFQKQATQTWQCPANWLTGHWSVRGCVLDDDANNPIVALSDLCFDDDDDDNDDNVILVARRDASICWLQLGQEYLTKLTTQWAQVTQELKKQEPQQQEEGQQREDSFEILAQFQIPSPTTKTNDDDKQQSPTPRIRQMVTLLAKHLFVLTEHDEIHYYSISPQGPLTTKTTHMILSNNGSNKKNGNIVSMHKVGHNKKLLVVHDNGHVVLFDIRTAKKDEVPPPQSMDLVLEDGDDERISSCTVDKDYWYFGTTMGNVMIYDAAIAATTAASSSTLQEQPQPALLFMTAFFHGGVSALAAGGPGVVLKGLSFVAGSTLGEVRQWELKRIGSSELAKWPQSSRQISPGKKHVIQTRQMMSSSQEQAEILKLQVFDLPFTTGQSVVLVATPHSLVLYDTKSGQSCFDMMALDHPDEFLLLDHDKNNQNPLLITNGMAQYLAVHDFSIPNKKEDDDNDDDDDYVFLW